VLSSLPQAAAPRSQPPATSAARRTKREDRVTVVAHGNIREQQASTGTDRKRGERTRPSEVIGGETRVGVPPEVIGGETRGVPPQVMGGEMWGGGTGGGEEGAGGAEGADEGTEESFVIDWG
jgi:hypothetical protein